MVNTSVMVVIAVAVDPINSKMSKTAVEPGARSSKTGAIAEMAGFPVMSSRKDAMQVVHGTILTST